MNIRSITQHAVILSVCSIPAAAYGQGGYVKFQEFDFGYFMWFLYAAIAVVLTLIVVNLIRSTSGSGNVKTVRKKRQKVQLDDFRERAAAFGFKLGETKTLERIAGRLSPKAPHNLLTAASGREYLMADLGKRIARRQREIKLLDRIVDKLRRMREADVHEREYVRVEADLSIWVAPKKKQLTEEVVSLIEDEPPAEVDIFDNLESVPGKLVDISEGGAAIEVDLDVEKGDMVDFWSADSHFVLSELTAGVVSAHRDQGADATTLHLHFMDPDMRELRLVIADLKSRSQPEAV